MTKFLIIFLIIVLGIIAGLAFLKKFIQKKINSTFGSFEQKIKNYEHEQKKKDVIYEKDDIIVLKGEAINNDKNGL